MTIYIEDILHDVSKRFEGPKTETSSREFKGLHIITQCKDTPKDYDWEYSDRPLMARLVEKEDEICLVANRRHTKELEEDYSPERRRIDPVTGCYLCGVNTPLPDMVNIYREAPEKINASINIDKKLLPYVTLVYVPYFVDREEQPVLCGSGECIAWQENFAHFHNFICTGRKINAFAALLIPTNPYYNRINIYRIGKDRKELVGSGVLLPDHKIIWEDVGYVLNLQERVDKLERLTKQIQEDMQHMRERANGHIKFVLKRFAEMEFGGPPDIATERGHPELKEIVTGLYRSEYVLRGGSNRRFDMLRNMGDREFVSPTHFEKEFGK